MAAFARGPDITVRLCDVIEYLQSDAVQEQAELGAVLLLKELNRLLVAADTCNDHLGKLERLIREVRAGRAEILSGDRALALKRFKAALEYWMKPAKKGE
jgi:hypothetical protein